MPIVKVTSSIIFKELQFSFSKSSGPGGQNVNKVNTKVSLRFDIAESSILREEQRTLLLQKLENKLTKEGVLILTSQEARSQLVNKELVVKKLDLLFESVLKVEVKRKRTKPTKASKKKRLGDKKHLSLKKANRQKP